MRKLALLMVLLAACRVWGQGSVDIVVPAKVATGSLVVAEIKDLGTRSAAWMAIEPLDLGYRTFNDGTYFVFASGCAKGRVILLVTVVDWDAKKLEQERVIVDIKGPGPKPDPDPDPDPKPGDRVVIMLAEEDNQTAYRELAINALHDYVRSKPGHKWGLFDPDQKDSTTGQRPGWLADYFDAAKDVRLPAMLVIAKQNGKELVSVVPFPPSGSTVKSGQAAGEAAIKILKELGG